MLLVSLAEDQLSAPTSTGSAVSTEPSDPGLKQAPRQSEALNSVHPSQTVNDGIKDGTDGGTHRPKPSHGSRSGPLHTDTLSVAENPVQNWVSRDPWPDAPGQAPGKGSPHRLE